MESLSNELLEAYKATHVSINGKGVQMECSKIWRDLKKREEEWSGLEGRISQSLADQWKRQIKKMSFKGIDNVFMEKKQHQTGHVSDFMC